MSMRQTLNVIELSSGTHSERGLKFESASGFNCRRLADGFDSVAKTNFDFHQVTHLSPPFRSTKISIDDA